jgi:AraC-like DNA-binding protein
VSAVVQKKQRESIMQATPMIRANLLAPILEALSAYDTSSLLRQQGLPCVHPIDPYQLIPLSKYVALFEQAALLLNQPFLGLKLGQTFKPELLGPLGFIFQASANLREALHHLSSYVSVWQSGTHMTLVQGKTTAGYTYQIDDPQLRPRRQDAEYSLAATCSLVRNLLGETWSPLEVHFEHEAADRCSARAYAQAFHAPVFFGQNVNRILIRNSDLARAGRSSDRSMVPFMERHLRDLAKESREPENFSSQVTHLIARRIGAGPLTLNAIAAELGLPPRSFQRRLSEERTSFRSLVREQRRSMAEALMKTTTVTRVAHTVGYAETAVLSRAFKLWTGTSPKTYARAISKSN